MPSQRSSVRRTCRNDSVDRPDMPVFSTGCDGGVLQRETRARFRAPLTLDAAAADASVIRSESLPAHFRYAPHSRRQSTALSAEQCPPDAPCNRRTNVSRSGAPAAKCATNAAKAASATPSASSNSAAIASTLSGDLTLGCVILPRLTTPSSSSPSNTCPLRVRQTRLARRPAPSRSAGQSVSRSVGRSVSWSVSWSVGRSVSWSVSWSVSQLVSPSVSQLVGCPLHRSRNRRRAPTAGGGHDSVRGKKRVE